MKDIHLRFTAEQSELIDGVASSIGVPVATFSRIAVLDFARLILRRQKSKACSNAEVWNDLINGEYDLGGLIMSDAPSVIAQAIDRQKGSLRASVIPVRRPLPNKREVIDENLNADGWQEFCLSLEDEPMTEDEAANMRELGYAPDDWMNYRIYTARLHAIKINKAGQ